jgi:hypothetical protein
MASGEAAVLFEALPERVGGGLPRLRYAERSQIEWRPVSLDDLAVDGRAGHPPADPRILLALWLYATVKGIGSARELARLCEDHVGFRWLCGGVGMNPKTLADFRVDHGAVLERLLVHSFTALVQAGGESRSRRAGWGAGACLGGGSVVSPAFDLGRLPARRGTDDPRAPCETGCRSRVCQPPASRGSPRRGRGA